MADPRTPVALEGERLEEERAAFEKWWDGWVPNGDDFMWAAWQARVALRGTEQPAEVEDIARAAFEEGWRDGYLAGEDTPGENEDSVRSMIHEAASESPTLERLRATPAQQGADEIEAFRAHLEEVGRPVQIATQAVVNRAREVANQAPGEAHELAARTKRLEGLIAAVRELERQEGIRRGRAPYRPAQQVTEAGQQEPTQWDLDMREWERTGKAPGQGQEPTGSKAGTSKPAPEVGAPTGAVEGQASAPRNELEAMVLERRAQQTGIEGWRSIDSAPKDGTVVLLARHVGDWGWVAGHGRWERFAGIEGWISHGFHPTPGELGLAHPDLWMPLPPPPHDTALRREDRDYG